MDGHCDVRAEAVRGKDVTVETGQFQSVAQRVALLQGRVRGL
jgi:hypothetical protein